MAIRAYNNYRILNVLNLCDRKMLFSLLFHIIKSSYLGEFCLGHAYYSELTFIMICVTSWCLYSDAYCDIRLQAMKGENCFKCLVAACQPANLGSDKSDGYIADNSKLSHIVFEKQQPKGLTYF